MTPNSNVQEFHVVTVRIEDRDWNPTGPQSKPPQGSRSYTYPTACRIALLLNLQRMSDRKTYVWTVVGWTSSNRRWYLLDVPTSEPVAPMWVPHSPFDLPPTVTVAHSPRQDFIATLSRWNWGEFREGRWKVAVSPIKRTFLRDASREDAWLQEVDEALFRCDALPPLPPLPDGNRATQTPENGVKPVDATPETSQAAGYTGGPYRLYQVGVIDDRGTVIPLTEPLSQTEALLRFDLIERNGAGKVVLIPAGKAVTP